MIELPAAVSTAEGILSACESFVHKIRRLAEHNIAPLMTLRRPLHEQMNGGELYSTESKIQAPQSFFFLQKFPNAKRGPQIEHG